MIIFILTQPALTAVLTTRVVAEIPWPQDIVAELLRVSPGYKPPPEFRPAKKQKKIFVPIQQYPGYNFIGLIIGPRGNTQKRMQQESGAKIALRGRGSVKDGRGRPGPSDPSDHEDLHVLISADTDEALEKVRS